MEITFGAGAYVPYEDLVRQAAYDVGLPDSAPTALLRDWADLKAWPDVAEVLTVLRAKGYKLGVVTNCSNRLGHIAAQKAGKGAVEGSANDAFDTVIAAEESGFYKPTREAYMAILNSMGFEPEDVLFVAGSAGDVEGATHAGMRVVWHNRVGLAKKGKAVPLKESSTLKDTLSQFLV